MDNNKLAITKPMKQILFPSTQWVIVNPTNLPFPLFQSDLKIDL